MIEEIKDKFKEECGVFGVYSKSSLDVAKVTYYGLYALQHRGQESAGIAVSDGKNMNIHKSMGLVSEAFDEKSLSSLKGNASIGHVRYSTTGSSNIINAQPILTNCKFGSMAIAHNGNLVNAEVIKELLEDGGNIFQTSIDSEVVLSLIARAYKKGIGKAVISAVQAIKGSFAMVILTEDKLIGVRDPNGIRPLCLGKLEDSYILSSESCAFDTVGAEFVRDIRPGEIVIIGEDGIESISYSEKIKSKVCAFEYIYFARPDSVIDGISVYESRRKAGEILFEECPVEADIVVGVPDSGLAAAVGFSKASSIPFGIGFIKNRYVGRSFIAPSKEMRERIVSLKLNPLKENIKGKRVVLVDDSIVRGTTSKILVEMLRRAGAKEVHFRVSSPVVKYPCYFGIDTPYRKDLIGANLTIEEIRKEIGADSLGYISEEGVVKSFGEKEGFCLGCFSGIYPVDTPIETAKDYLER
ncbi:amidophosphoribosyltransferase [Clostridium algidicarnis]|uniref:Amidophosphoribosyltransferase n=1 Tax=Clostridium algidicarnis TaxID=37659 RepID=A0ABS6C5P9_9CLOT|nr:amidophosphoribosyltransferase [Clostridium algidicarnis]MBU3220811.1 amidophosphoribosyltransferase [Clostridium algidicarnis]MCB2285889.1 amidophosphoribosyltransferase [Clostridium algidicarnis]